MPPRKVRSRRSPHSLVAFLSGISKICSYLIAAVLAAAVLAYIKKGALPQAADISRELLKEPEQIETEVKPFSFAYRGETYQVEPVADYHIRGLVVSHNDITAFGDIYHDENSVDIKDLCLIWGSNVIDDLFHNVRFHNESVSCHFYARSDAAETFDTARISNNHLISADEEVRKTIRSIRVGDQVILDGMLVNYAPAAHPKWVRQSSTVRTDSGGGACEVMYVNELKVLKAAPRMWFRLYEGSWNLLFILFPLKLVLFILVPWLDLKLNR